MPNDSPKFFVISKILVIQIMCFCFSQKHSIEQFLTSTLKSPSKIIFSKFAKNKSKFFFVMYLNALRYRLCLDIKNNSQAILF